LDDGQSPGFSLKKYHVVARETELTRHVLPGIAEIFPFLGKRPM
jgi:hypothetical protein